MKGETGQRGPSSGCVASNLGNHQRELTDVATKYSQRAQNLERELTETATKYSLCGVKSWNANSIGLIPMVRLDAGSMHRTNDSRACAEAR